MVRLGRDPAVAEVAPVRLLARKIERPDVVIERDDRGRALAFGAKREPSVPAADVEHGAAREIGELQVRPLAFEEIG